MIKFFIYLLESSLCLCILLFLYLIIRKETYFKFCRAYLLGVATLAIIFPLLSINISINNNGGIGRSFSKIASLKASSELLLMEGISDNSDGIVADEQPANIEVATMPEHNENTSANSFLIWGVLCGYVFGVLFFLSKFIYLVFWIRNIRVNNKQTYYEGLKLVVSEKEIASFSFLKCVFVSRDTYNSENFEQIIAHEKIHIAERHSLDLILTHIVAIFMWFNPFVWILLKLMKTNHEFLADRGMVERGHSFNDYQYLLLSQLISKHSVGLVNNFSLLSIKKRIEMMNKLKTGIGGKLRIVLVTSFCLIVFVMFSEFSINSTGSSLTIEKEESKTEKRYSALGIELPDATHYKKVLHNELSFAVYLDHEKLYVNEKEVEYDKLASIFANEKSLRSQELQNKITVRLFIDKNVAMDRVVRLKQELRKAGLLKVAYVIEPEGVELVNSNDYSYARLMKLPPLGVMEILKVVP